MAWTAPKTWESGEIVTAAGLNEQLSDNLTFLKTALDNNTSYTADEGADYTTTSATFEDVDATNLALTITTTGNVLVGFSGSFVSSSAGETIYLNVDVDGTDHFNDSGLVAGIGTATSHVFNVSFVVLITGLTDGEHTFKLRWRRFNSGTLTLYAGAGTANYDLHPQFWVQEVGE